MTEKHLIVGKGEGTTTIIATTEEILSLLDGTPKGALLRKYYQRYKEMNLFEEKGAERDFLEQMSVVTHLLDWPYVVFFTTAKKSGKPIKREITKAIRFLGEDGKEYIRFAAKFTGENKHEEIIEQHIGSLGVWEEPVFRKKYNKDLEDFTESMEVARTIQHCEYPFPSALKELAREMTNKTLFYIADEARKFRIYEREDWEQLSRKDLIAREREKNSQDSNKLVGQLVDALKKGE